MDVTAAGAMDKRLPAAYDLDRGVCCQGRLGLGGLNVLNELRPASIVANYARVVDSLAEHQIGHAGEIR
jgi:hypothetical protein